MKYIFILVLGVFNVSTSFSQGFHFGIKGGADLHKVDGKSFKEEYKLGYHAGVFAEIKFNKKIGLQPELYFSQINTRTSSNFNDVYGFNGITKIKLSYINLPVLLNVKLAPILSFQAGPQFGILIDNEKNIVQNGRDAFSKGDVAAVVGLQLNVKKIKVYTRYNYGVTNVNNKTDEDWKNQTFHVGVGFRIL